MQSPPNSRPLHCITELPTFNTRFQHHYHNDVEEIKANSQAYFLQRWPFESQKQKDRYPATVIEEWSSMIVYGAPKYRAEVYAKMMTWLTFIDDTLERLNLEASRVMASRTIAILRGSNIPGPAHLSDEELVAVDLIDMVKNAPSNVFGIQAMTDLFIEALCQYLLVVSSKDERRASVEQGIEAYMKYRSEDVAAYPPLCGQLWAREVVIPPHILSDNDTCALVTAFLYENIALNDMFSYDKERRQQEETPHLGDMTDKNGFTWCNGVFVFMQFHHMELSDAMKEVKGLAHYYEDQLVNILDKLKVKYSGSPGDAGAIGKFGKAMMDFLGGSVHYYKYSLRYNAVADQEP